MGKGDKKSKKGKIWRSSFGKTRLRKKKRLKAQIQRAKLRVKE
ncbi:MAG: 30S ribosomal protein THX [Spirochaetales bacterium]|nr:30S ribosomal protein THX [Spirochaetales bacterium]